MNSLQVVILKNFVLRLDRLGWGLTARFLDVGISCSDCVCGQAVRLQQETEGREHGEAQMKALVDAAEVAASEHEALRSDIAQKKALIQQLEEQVRLTCKVFALRPAMDWPIVGKRCPCMAHQQQV